jgi:hypothetical protein
MTTLAEQLKEMNEEISDKKFVTVVLGSLPESYDNLISSLNSHKIDELKWENIKALLIEGHLKRTEKDAKQHDSSPHHDALFTKKGNQSGKTRHQEHYPRRKPQERFSSSTKCFKCGKLGHIVRNCPLNKSAW